VSLPPPRASRAGVRSRTPLARLRISPTIRAAGPVPCRRCAQVRT